MASVPDQGQSFGSRVRAAVFWRSGSQILAQLVMWASTILVVRLLDPADYGLFAMTQAVLVILNFLNGYSFASSLVQADSVDEKRIAQVFGILILLNAVLGAVQFIAAPLAAAYFHQPLVADMLRVQALLYIATPFITLPSALLSRALDFRKQALVNLASALAGALTALACALAGWGVWTLIAAPIALFFTRAIGLTVAARLLVIPSFDFRGAGEMLGFGGAMLLAQGFWIIQSQADIVIAGHVLDAHNLGLYAEALFVAQIFTAKFVPPLNEVAFPAYARLDKDGGAVGDAFVKAVRLVMFAALPLYLGLAATAAPFIETVFGSKWLGMAPLVEILALAMPFFALQILFAPATNALGRPGLAAWTGAAGAVIMPLCFMVGIERGTTGLALAWLVAAPALLGVTAMLSLPVIGARLTDLARGLAVPVLAAVVMALVVMFANRELAHLAAPARLALLVPLGGLAYLGIVALFARALLKEVTGLLFRRDQDV